MTTLDNNGDITYVQGSGSKPYELKNVSGVLSCSCPAWRNQGFAIDKRTCKHLIAVLGAETERARVGDDQMPTKFRIGSGQASPMKGNAMTTPVQTSATPPIPSGSGLEVLLANKWKPGIDPRGWWLSEKLDGVRAYWDGTQFLSRNGNVFHAPDWFRSNLPPFPLDGELWIARQSFQETISVVRRLDGGEAWRKVKYLVFDAPEHEGGFEERFRCLNEWLDREQPPYAEAHPHRICSGVDDLREELAQVVAAGGEGIMLRKSGSLYERRRSSTLLKVKQFQDLEVTVLGHVPGRGKHRGRLGSLLVSLPDGKSFNIGTGMSDADRENPPPIGCRVTIRFTEKTVAGIPKCASFVAVRDYE